MRLPLLLTLTASVGLASAKKCKPRSSKLSSAVPASSLSLGSISSVGSSIGLEPSHLSEPASVVASSSGSAASSVASSAASSAPSSAASSGSVSSAASSGASSVSSAAPSSSSSPPQPSQICQVQGSRALRPIQESDRLTDNNFSGCKALCLAQAGCLSFSFQVETGGFCSLYTEALYTDIVVTTSGSTHFFDVDCPGPVVSGPEVVKALPAGTVPLDNVPKGPEAVVVLPPYSPPSPTRVSSDSPPYIPSGAPSKPADDNEFIKTYTYTQYELPTVVAEGRPPVTTGIPLQSGGPLPCMLTAGQEHPFSLVNEAYVPLVSRTGSLGPMLQPTEAPAPGDPILNPLTMVLPAFYLQEVSGTPDLYDMIYEKTGEYVAITSSGEVILVSSSTGPSFNGDHATTIFSFDCRGTIFVSVGSSKYEWSTKGKSCSISAVEAPKNNMKVLPVNLPKIPISKRDMERATELLEKHNAGRDLEARVNTDFSEPQCPNTPAGLFSGTKEGFEMGQGNFCEDLNKWWGLSPFDFEGACFIQSLCFDQCSGFSFAGCVAMFAASMYASCLNEFGSWWDILQATACAVQAHVFTGFAATDTGKKLYNKANDAMCRCFCSNPGDTCVFVDKEGKLTDDFYCANIKGSDLDNCGNCGRRCGADSACHSGVCGCPRDQCGTTCLDFRNNPNHCGACDQACDPPYCIGGTCYKPSPDECAPDQAVFNGGFLDWQYGFTNWTMAGFPGTVLGTDISFGSSRYTYDATKPWVRSLGVEINNIPAAGHHALLTQKKVKMCPGFNYELKFNMGYVNTVNNNSVTSNADCQVRWLTGVPSTPSSDGGFKVSPWYTIGASAQTYRTFGPWIMGSAKEGDVGVTKVKASLYVDLSAVISCTTPVGGFGNFIITGITMDPVSKADKRSPTLGGEAIALPVVEERDVKATNMTQKLEPIYSVTEETSGMVSVVETR